ncbi:MAG: hypothetical protein HQK96_01575 [Nitrospirae bacterium]|nr:hypothetical protein [Nitrospirota bacterium]
MEKDKAWRCGRGCLMFPEEEDWKMNSVFAANQLRLIGSDQDNPYKKRAFLLAANTVEGLGERLGSYFPDKFNQINGIGESIAQVLKDLFFNGISVRAEVARLDLEKRGLIKHKKSGDIIRRPLIDAKSLILPLLDGIQLFDGVLKTEVAGSIRREMPYVADADILVATNDARARRLVCEWLYESGKNAIAGDEQASAIFDNDFQVDIHFCTNAEYGCHLLHFTGSKEHNIKMRGIAKSRGLKLNQRNIEIVERGKVIFFKTEEDVFSFLDMEYILPKERF